jgi:hypothetical protein
MLRIYETILEVLRMLRPVVAQIEAHDRDLARRERRVRASMWRCRSDTSSGREHFAVGIRPA